MAKLFLLRHLKSQWNEEENRFTGWVDVCLQENQQERAMALAQEIFKNNTIDVIYSSSLFRNMDTIARILEYDKRYPIFIHLDGGKMQKWGNFVDLSDFDVPVYVSEKLNERYYGKIQGEYKEEIINKYGEEKVHLWRRGYNIAPPEGESLKDVIKRTIPFYKKYVEKDLKEKNVLIVASHNALRAIVKHVENISDKDIINLEIPFGGLLKYSFDFDTIKPLEK
jgi:2,3-bisphosphoglycerate-dependent phosphoglycerate mutase